MPTDPRGSLVGGGRRRILAVARGAIGSDNI